MSLMQKFEAKFAKAEHPEFRPGDTVKVYVRVIEGDKGLRTVIRMDRWRTSDQKQRWGASALSLIKPRLRRIKGYRHLPHLRAALQAKTGKAERMEGTSIP